MNENKKKGIDAIEFESRYYANIGNYYRVKDGSMIQIIDYKTNKEVYYKFITSDECERYTFCTTMQNIKNGQIKNPFTKNIYGGYLGIDNSYRSNQYKWVYNIWMSILRRKVNRNQDYDIDPIWMNYSNFAKWYIDQYNMLNHELIQEYIISIDILYNWYKIRTGGRKVFSSMTCELIPKHFSYDQLDFYHDNHCISEKLYSILKGENNYVQ